MMPITTVIVAATVVPAMIITTTAVIMAVMSVIRISESKRHYRRLNHNGWRAIIGRVRICGRWTNRRRIDRRWRLNRDMWRPNHDMWQRWQRG